MPSAASGDRKSMRWVTFDCFGTLVDWNSGFAAILRPLVGDRTPRVMDTYHQFERLPEQETPHRLYKDVLATGLRRAAEDVGIPLSRSEEHTSELQSRSDIVCRLLLEKKTYEA